MKLETIHQTQKYIVSGTELYNIDKKIKDLRTDCEWLRTYLRDALNCLTSEPATIPQFVAKIGLTIANLDEIITKSKNKMRDGLCGGIEVEPLHDNTEDMQNDMVDNSHTRNICNIIDERMR